MPGPDVHGAEWGAAFANIAGRQHFDFVADHGRRDEWIEAAGFAGVSERFDPGAGGGDGSGGAGGAGRKVKAFEFD